MITSRRDYIVRVIEELGRVIARLSARRKQENPEETALETIVMGFQRLLVLDADQIFLLTPDQHFTMLVRDEPPDVARDKVLTYAALSTEAGHVYARKGNAAIARATWLNALRFVLKAQTRWSMEGAPDYAPRVDDLLALVKDAPLDAETAALLSQAKAS